MIRWMIPMMMTLTLGCASAPKEEPANTVKETNLEAPPTPEAPPKTASGLETLRAQVGEGVKMLESKEYRRVMERFVHPKDMGKLAPQMENPEFITSFGEKKAPMILSIFRHMLTPEAEISWSEDASAASVKVPEDLSSPKPTMKMGLVDGKWYIFN